VPPMKLALPFWNEFRPVLAPKLNAAVASAEIRQRQNLGSGVPAC